MLEKFSWVVLSGVFIFSAWKYFDNVSERNAMLREVMTCMEDDKSRESYNRCFKEVNNI